MTCTLEESQIRRVEGPPPSVCVSARIRSIPTNAAVLVILFAPHRWLARYRLPITETGLFGKTKRTQSTRKPIVKVACWPRKQASQTRERCERGHWGSRFRPIAFIAFIVVVRMIFSETRKVLFVVVFCFPHLLLSIERRTLSANDPSSSSQWYFEFKNTQPRLIDRGRPVRCGS